MDSSASGKKYSRAEQGIDIEPNVPTNETSTNAATGLAANILRVWVQGHHVFYAVHAPSEYETQLLPAGASIIGLHWDETKLAISAASQSPVAIILIEPTATELARVCRAFKAQRSHSEPKIFAMFAQDERQVMYCPEIAYRMLRKVGSGLLHTACSVWIGNPYHVLCFPAQRFVPTLIQLTCNSKQICGFKVHLARDLVLLSCSFGKNQKAQAEEFLNDINQFDANPVQVGYAP
jgi:hypothetical protein